MAHEDRELFPPLSAFDLKEVIMKNLRSVLSILALLLVATTAQAQQRKVLANVPFDFIVGDRAYTAGEYSLKSMANIDAVIRIDNTQEAVGGFVYSSACESVTPSANTKLVFRRMGDYYFLYQVWVEGSLSGREFPKSRTEVRLAQNHEKSEFVIVAANISH